MQVSYSEGVASHTGPEFMRWYPRGCRRSVDRGAHRPAIEPQNLKVPGADVFVFTEGKMDGATTRAPAQPGVVEDPEHVRKLFAREPGGLGFGRRLDTAGPHREDEES